MANANLTFDPADLPAGAALGPEVTTWSKWFLALRQHPEFHDIEVRTSRVTSPLEADKRWDFEANVFWHTWRAATWDPPDFTELDANLKRGRAAMAMRDQAAPVAKARVTGPEFAALRARKGVA